MTEPTPLPSARQRAAAARRHRRPARSAPPLEDRGVSEWARDHIAELGSCFLGAGSIALGFAYQVPALTRPVPRPGARTVSVVQYIDAIGPIWFAGFVLVGVLALVGILVGPKLLTVAHGAGLVMYGMFSCAAWLGWAFSDPRPAVVAPILALLVSGFQLLMVLVYSARRE